MKLPETELVYEAEVSFKKSSAGNEIRVAVTGRIGVAFDQQTAAEFLPILKHFAETGEVPN